MDFYRKEKSIQITIDQHFWPLDCEKRPTFWGFGLCEETNVFWVLACAKRPTFWGFGLCEETSIFGFWFV
jgi:hypothetical protein